MLKPLERLLVWARSSMTSLYPTVSKDDLLEIFITLPPNSADSSSLIAETIYSSSATMDGRRFAQEFLKRRQKLINKLVVEIMYLGQPPSFLQQTKFKQLMKMVEY